MNPKAFNSLAGVAQGKGCPRSAWPAVPGRSNPLVAQIILWICLVINSVFSFHSPAAGVWTPLANLAPDGVELMLLLPDGTVMAADEPGGTNYSAIWYLLTPDIHGSYVNGTWSQLASMSYTRYDYSSIVLTNGQVFVAGGEYGTGFATSEVYNPLSNIWTSVSVPASLLDPAVASPEVGENQGFYDSIAKILGNGQVLIAPDGASTYGGTLLFNPATSTWSAGPTSVKKAYPDQAEASWVKLPDDSFLTVDPSSTNSERFIPSLLKWITDTDLPVHLCTNGEIGPAVLLPNGRAIFFGATGHTALYTPSGTTNLGTWTAGPDIPDGMISPDAPAAALSNGKVLCAVEPLPVYSAPTSFYEYDPFASSFTAVSGPTGSTYFAAPYYTKMLDLPDGSVLFSTGGYSQLYTYRPDGSPVASGKPTISSITYNTETATYLLTGILLNGISEGASYGDDAQMDGNYPLVRLTDAATNVYYARTCNWNSTSVQATNRLVSVQFVLPASLPLTDYSLVAVANGIASDPVTLPMPLQLQIVPGGPANVVLTWPAYPANIALEINTNLASSNWMTVTNPPVLVGNNFILTNPAAGAAAFFRLHIP
jgi:hypothetical protein